MHCSSFSSLRATESSPTIISRGALRFYVIAGMAPRIRKRKNGMLCSGYVYSKGARNTSVTGVVDVVVENRTEWRLNGRIDKCDSKNIPLMMGWLCTYRQIA